MRKLVLSLPLRFLAAALLLASSAPSVPAAPADFFLKSGDIVVFYGDSITERSLYTNLVESYVLTRFPNLDVRFVNSGWGGDTVAGGAGGPLQLRLQRDVIAYHPSVVTVLLGMNDGHYRKLTGSSYRDFTAGYQKLVQTLKAALPNVRLTLLEPSPYDDITQPPQFPGGYNAELMRFGQFIGSFAASEKIPAADLNAAVRIPLAAIHAKDPAAAREFIPDRVHPGPAASLLMAEALLKTWNASAIVTEVEIDASSLTAAPTFHTRVASLARNGGGLSWTQTDAALPFPVDWQDPPESVAAYSSDFIPAIDDQPLRIKNLAPGDYTLQIDGQPVVTYPDSQFAKGINLALLPTPMLQQAAAVLKLVGQQNDLHLSRWRVVQVPFEQSRLPHYSAALSVLDALDREAISSERAAAQPRSHRYEIVPKPSRSGKAPR